MSDEATTHTGQVLIMFEINESITGKIFSQLGHHLPMVVVQRTLDIVFRFAGEDLSGP